MGGIKMEPIFIKEFLPIQILNFINSYCIMEFSKHKNFKTDTQTNSLIGINGNNVMETLLDLSTPVIEKNVNKKLWPTYSYLRIYDKGSDLKSHLDRESCEYTVALCLGASPIDVPYDIFIGDKDVNSDYKYFSENKKLTPLKIDYKFPMYPNNALIFQGREKYHWREVCEHDHFITVFLHYVDQDGPYREYKYDEKESLTASK